MRTAGCCLAVTAVLLVYFAPPTLAGENPYFTLPLHAKVSTAEPCDGYLPVDCLSNRPTVDVDPGPVVVFLFVMNYNSLVAVQTAFAVDPGWTYVSGQWDCQPGQLWAVVPHPPFGPTDGSIATAFNCLAGPELAVIGLMHFMVQDGCLSQVQSTYPFGIHVLDCALELDQIPPGEEARLGKICVQSGGWDACDRLHSTPLAPVTWGRIKSQY